ncbi:unnamed protein product [Lepeophtheirus salmonis]|uniref:(salmon louse) hypothetical protein n=1 Tax=Lepeophtheirus salmonis TaxID=72036 RepID=A0A7R8H3G6_LEPSM|nr:unnamed protein product [Lepeophtheirus salmonis]CAF2843763.1 unnamed protein product [Lepeophtheirus salmonis]
MSLGIKFLLLSPVLVGFVYTQNTKQAGTTVKPLEKTNVIAYESQRFREPYWSNHACATSTENSPICSSELSPFIPFSASSSASLLFHPRMSGMTSFNPIYLFSFCLL